MRFLKLTSFIYALFIYASCSKNSDPVSFTPSLYFLSGGISSFDNNLLLFSSSDTIRFNAIISTTFLLSKNVYITVGVDDAARSNYNSSYGTNYQSMPSDAYSFPATFTASDSSVYDTIQVTIFKHALNAQERYMLPINIVNPGGINVNLTESVIYLHIENNELSGIYTATGTRISYNGDAADSSVNSTDSFTIAKSLVPVDSSKSELDYADLGSNGWKYSLSFFTDIPGAPPQFTVGANPVILSSIQSASFKILKASYDSITKNIYIKSSYKNTSGNERIVEESLKLQ